MRENARGTFHALHSPEPSRSADRRRDSGASVSYQVTYRDGTSFRKGAERPAFTLLLKDPGQLERFLDSDIYSAAVKFIRGDVDIRGDIIAAIRFKTATTTRGFRYSLACLVARLEALCIESWIRSPHRAARNIRFHYDRSNEFYRAFLDSRMVYSCAYFKNGPQDSLDDAQLAKLDHICRKLDLRPDELFLDIGCGWGALAVRAAERYGAFATGCTLSLRQDLFTANLISERRLQHRVRILESDYAKLSGQFDKVASVGMFEHVGRRRLRRYFRKVFTLLRDDGLFLNHGIVRPEGATDGPETLFLQKKVFPGGELATLSTVIREAGRAGFEILDVENLRPHYALTCHRWVERLQQNVEECLRHVSREAYRTWLLYLAGSAISFESGATDVCQILMAKRRPTTLRRLTREYMYA